MNESILIISLIAVIMVLLCVILYQQFAFHKGMGKNLREISQKIADILEQDSAEQIMVFTDNKELISLCGQLNCLLLDRQKIKIDFKRQEESSKKMLSNISHDIKTPLTVILGYLEIMRLSDKENVSLQKVEAKAQQVMELINQFFTLAKLEAGDTQMELIKVNINELCRENILGFYDILQQKDFAVEISIPEQDISVLGSEEAIHRILSNLISNAVRYGSAGGYIGLTLREDETYAFVDIVDKGRGIERAFAASVFERLYTMEDSRNRNIHGNGLGLTIAKNLANKLGGDITLESEPNVKTVFTVQLRKV